VSDYVLLELAAARAAAEHWEVTSRRASDGARSASKGAERLQRMVARLKEEVKLLKGRNDRLQHECSEQGKKISRLSLELLSALSRSTEGAGDATT
jgi:predicted RNase H-like nuclease (RuvC/YqgF family)